MSRSPLDLLKKHEFKEKMDKYIVEVEKYIDGQMDLNYGEFLNSGQIIIQCDSISVLLFQQSKDLPMLIETSLEMEFPEMYPEWDIELKRHRTAGSSFIFTPRKTEKQEDGSVSEIESRSELLDLEPDIFDDDDDINKDEDPNRE